MSELGPMTRAAFGTTVGLILRELRLGERGWIPTLLYSDLIRGSFCLHDPSEQDQAIIQKHLSVLVSRYKWKPPVTTIDKRRNVITLTIQRDRKPDETGFVPL